MNVKEANRILAENGIEGELIWAHDYAEQKYAEYIKKEAVLDSKRKKHIARKNR